jgi:hypothetical protein
MKVMMTKSNLKSIDSNNRDPSSIDSNSTDGKRTGGAWGSEVKKCTSNINAQTRLSVCTVADKNGNYKYKTIDDYKEMMKDKNCSSSEIGKRWSLLNCSELQNQHGEILKTFEKEKKKYTRYLNDPFKTDFDKLIHKVMSNLEVELKININAFGINTEDKLEILSRDFRNTSINHIFELLKHEKFVYFILNSFNIFKDQICREMDLKFRRIDIECNLKEMKFPSTSVTVVDADIVTLEFLHQFMNSDKIRNTIKNACGLMTTWLSGVHESDSLFIKVLHTIKKIVPPFISEILHKLLYNIYAQGNLENVRQLFSLSSHAGFVMVNTKELLIEYRDKISVLTTPYATSQDRKTMETKTNAIRSNLKIKYAQIPSEHRLWITIFNEPNR